MCIYQPGDKFHNRKGNIEAIVFLDESGVLLEADEDKSNKRFIPLDAFESQLDKEWFIKKEVEVPAVILTDYQKEFIDEKILYLKVLKELVELGHKATVEETYKLLIPLVEKREPKTQMRKHPARTTLAKYWKMWRKTFKDDAVACKRRQGRTRLNPATEAFLQKHVNTVFSDSNSTFIKGYYNNYKRKAIDANKANPDIKVASRRTYARRLGELNAIEEALNRPNLTQAERNQRLLTLRRRITTYFSMQRVECDRVHLNMCLIDDDTGKPTPPVKLDMAIDAYSRAIVGVSLSFGAECKEAGVNLIRQLYLSDSNLFMEGKPTVLIMDNGPAFNNELVQKTAENLGISLKYTPSNEPAKKPFIESFFNTLRNNMLRGMTIETKDGKETVGMNSYAGKRTKHNAPKIESLEKIADLYVSDFKYLLNVFLTEYHNKVHNETGISPAAAWRKSMVDTPRARSPYRSVQSCFHVCLDDYGGKDNALQPNGRVRVLKNDFSSVCTDKQRGSKWLYKTLQRLKAKGKNPRVKVFYDKWDARQVTIVVWYDGSHEPISVIAYNIDLLDFDSPVSFDEVNDKKSICEDIWQPMTHSLTGYYYGVIEKFAERNVRRRPQGREIGSFNENNANKLNTNERIRLAHDVESKKYKDITANSTIRADQSNDDAPYEQTDTLAEYSAAPTTLPSSKLIDDEDAAW